MCNERAKNMFISCCFFFPPLFLKYNRRLRRNFRMADIQTGRHKRIMFALIKWSEDGKFSILPTEHIRDFDEEEYLNGLEEKDIYLVEWRQGAKEPKGGWPVYEASIIKLAGAFSPV